MVLKKIKGSEGASEFKAFMELIEQEHPKKAAHGSAYEEEVRKNARMTYHSNIGGIENMR